MKCPLLKNAAKNTIEPQTYIHTHPIRDVVGEKGEAMDAYKRIHKWIKCENRRVRRKPRKVDGMRPIPAPPVAGQYVYVCVCVDDLLNFKGW